VTHHPATPGTPGWVVLAGSAVIFMAGGALGVCMVVAAGRALAARLGLAGRVHDDHGRQPRVGDDGWAEFVAGHEELRPPGEERQT